jgi:hypothetical protein
VTIGERQHLQALLPSRRPADLQLVADPQPSIRFCGLAVRIHFAAPARLLGFRACSEHARDIQPDVQPDAVTALILVDHFAASFYSSRAEGVFMVRVLASFVCAFTGNNSQ